MSNPDRNALIAEVGFLLAKYHRLDNPRELDVIENEARRFLMRLPRSGALQAPMEEDEWHEAHSLSMAIASYTNWLASPVFNPVVPGCGVVDEAVADVLAGTELIEVKTVNRPFRSGDFRQVLTYSAMYYAANIAIEKITLLNPRKCHLVSASLEMIAGSAAGKAPVELMQELVEWMVGLQVSA